MDKKVPLVSVRSLSAEEAMGCIDALADVLIDCVEGGASVSFMLPLSRDRALAFWRGVIDGVGRGERVLLVAEDAAAADRRHGAIDPVDAGQPAAPGGRARRCWCTGVRRGRAWRDA